MVWLVSARPDINSALSFSLNYSSQLSYTSPSVCLKNNALYVNANTHPCGHLYQHGWWQPMTSHVSSQTHSLSWTGWGQGDENNPIEMGVRVSLLIWNYGNYRQPQALASTPRPRTRWDPGSLTITVALKSMAETMVLYYKASFAIVWVWKPQLYPLNNVMSEHLMPG